MRDKGREGEGGDVKIKREEGKTYIERTKSCQQNCLIHIKREEKRLREEK